MIGRASKSRSVIRSQIWFIPMMAIVGATVLALGTTWMDRQLAGTGVFQELFARNPEAVRTALSVVASSILTFTALVFTITMVVVQQAANRLSPRLMRTFLEDRVSQVTLGVFTGTFAYSLLVLRDIRSPSEGASFVPGISVAVVFLAVFASLGVFVVYLHHITQSLRVNRVARRIADETSRAIDDAYPQSGREKAPGLPARKSDEPTTPVPWDGEGGHLQSIDEEALLEVAEEHRLHIHVSRHIGEFIPRGAPVILLHGDARQVDVSKLTSALETGESRSVDSDITFGIRQLVDIAEKALSPAMNDPTTAVEALDRIHDLLRKLADRPIPTQLVFGDTRSWVTVESPGWDQIVELAIEEIRHYGADSIQITRRLRRVIEDLLTVVDENRAPVLQRQLALLAESADQDWLDPAPAAAEDQRHPEKAGV